MTVSRGAAGKAMVMFISNIWRRSTEEEGTHTHVNKSKGTKSTGTLVWKSELYCCVLEYTSVYWELTNEDEDLVVRVSEQHGH